MDKKERNATRAIVNKAWHALPHLSGSGWGDGREKLADMYTAEERQHRKIAPAGYTHPTTIADAAKLLAVADLARCLFGQCANDKPAWADFLKFRHSFLVARALAEVNAVAIRKAWADAGLAGGNLAELNYADYVNSSGE